MTSKPLASLGAIQPRRVSKAEQLEMDERAYWQGLFRRVIVAVAGFLLVVTGLVYYFLR